MEKIYFLILVVSAIFYTAFSVNKDREFIESIKDYQNIGEETTEEFVGYIIMLVSNVMAVLNIAIILKLAWYGAFGR